MKTSMKIEMKKETTYYALKVMQETYKLSLSKLVCMCVIEKWGKLLETHPELKTKLFILQKTGGRGRKHIEDRDDYNK